MVFSINSCTKMISGTKGDSGTISFQFNRDMDGSTVIFSVKKDIATDDTNAYITKMVTFPTTDAINAAGGGNPNNVIAVVLDPTDTVNLPIPNHEDDDECIPHYADFVWGLKVLKGTTYIETVVPVTGGSYPKFRMYYNINSAINITPPVATQTFYATTINVDVLTLQPAQVPQSTIILTMVSENGGTGKQTLAVPLIWGTVQSIYQYNTITLNWEQISNDTFDLSLVVISSTSYRQYTNNTPTIGSRQLTFNF